MKQNGIVYLQRHEIETANWDRCIDEAPNGRIYAYSYYLDALCTNWDALVWNNYEAVMPLPWRRKWGIHYLYHPAFIAQLGLFGKQLTADLLQHFLDSIPKKFRYWDLVLNQQNDFSLPSYPLYKRTNYTLSLQPPYAWLHARFGENTKRNSRKAAQNGCTAATAIGIGEVLNLAKKTGLELGTGENDYARFKQLFALLHDRQQAKTYGLFDASQRLLASCVFFFSHQRAYYILVGNHPDGRKLGASHALIDFFIQETAGSNLVLDFEGSDAPGVARFYSGFGALREAYTALRWNRLPPPLKWLKK